MKIGSTDMPVVDVDTHVIEPPDLWTARLPKKYHDAAPHIRWDDTTHALMWFFLGERVFPALSAAHAGWHECPPSHPLSWEDVDPATYELSARVARMDEYGITVQLLYPNVAMFTSGTLQEAKDVNLQNELIRAYNDWQFEWSSAASNRFACMISLPFWDLEATKKEIERCSDLGFKGVVFTQDPTAFDLPALGDPHWDPMWAIAQERKLPVNFHVGSSKSAQQRRDTINNFTQAGLGGDPRPVYSSASSAMTFLSNAQTIAQLILTGICHRFPELKLVSVESGAGYMTFLLEALDWQWTSHGLAQMYPDHLLPSEYFARQIYGTFWFERQSALQAIEALGSSNLMYETDFPHPTSMSPGPGSPGAVAPPRFVNDVLTALEDSDLRNILYRNAAQIYQLDAVLATA